MSRASLIAVMCLVLSICAIATYGQNQTPSPSAASSVASAEQRNALASKLKEYQEGYKGAQWRYSWSYHFCVYLAAILSALAAWLSKVHVKRLGLDDPGRRDTWTASMAAGAALLIGISTAGSLADRWQDNKKNRYAVESLMNQFDAEHDPTYDELEAYGKRLAQIIDPNTDLVIPPK